jgi:hypothetical protein
LDRPGEFRNLLECSSLAAAGKSRERPGRARQQRQRRHVKTPFPLDPAAGFRAVPLDQDYELNL